MEINTRDIIKIHSKINNWKYFPLCKWEEYEFIRSNSICLYYPTKSNKQIKTIIRYSRTKRGMKIYHRLLALLAKHVKVDHYTTFLQSFLYKNKSDLDIYNYIRLYKHKTNPDKKRKKKILGCKDRNILHGQEYYYHLTKLLKGSTFKIKSYLDIGCGDCKLTVKLGKLLRLPISKIHGADIKEWSEYTQERRKSLPINITLFEKGKPLPFKSQLFSLISVLMVLHHVENLSLMLTEIYRILEPGGYVLVREHDALTNADYILCDIEHMLYEVVKYNHDDAINTYTAKYYGLMEWTYIFEKYGFKYERSGYQSNSIYHEIAPTKGVWIIYQKPLKL